MALTLDHVHMRCKDPQATEDFYVNMFGGEVVGRFEVRGMSLVRIKVGDVFLALSPKRDDEPEPQEANPGWGIYELGLLVDDVHQAFEELSAKGGPVLRPAPGGASRGGGGLSEGPGWGEDRDLAQRLAGGAGFARRRHTALAASLASSAYWHIRLRVSLAAALSAAVWLCPGGSLPLTAGP